MRCHGEDDVTKPLLGPYASADELEGLQRAQHAAELQRAQDAELARLDDRIAATKADIATIRAAAIGSAARLDRVFAEGLTLPVDVQAAVTSIRAEAASQGGCIAAMDNPCHGDTGITEMDNPCHGATGLTAMDNPCHGDTGLTAPLLGPTYNSEAEKCKALALEEAAVNARTEAHLAKAAS
ncbi:hypothetical protein FOA52_012426 [Chlamydomonas sp. UWO 241]|nr:hypothetical protein FOA52_012426 [Chlamydomonas sp. UWO 241]